MINDLRLQHFRSYQDDSFEFDQGVNIIVGPNASGKTNLLEAVLVACVGGSYRSGIGELIQHGQTWARLDTHSEDASRVVKFEALDGGRPKKTYQIDGSTFARLPLHKVQPVVLFEPNHLQLLHGSPEGRREFMDNLLEQTIAGFGVIRRQYKRVLAQRNALLKQDASVGKQQLFAWNIRLSELGGQIAARRLELVKSINETLQDLYRQLSKTKDSVSVDYVSSCGEASYSSSMLHKLDSGSDLDFKRGFTAYGPHRDDLMIKINNYAAPDAASRGEIRTILLSLKIIEMKLLEDAHQKRPLLLLDDVFSELDGARRRALTDFLSGHQTFITTTDADVVVQHFMDKCHIIPLS